MRYFYQNTSKFYQEFGETYICNHPVYNKCTLFKIKSKGLAVIQQRYDEIDKKTYWTNIDGYLTHAIYIHPKFIDYFRMMASEEKDGLYPTVTIRQIMWALKMKPLKRAKWETVFDRKFI